MRPLDYGGNLRAKYPEQTIARKREIVSESALRPISIGHYSGLQENHQSVVSPLFHHAKERTQSNTTPQFTPQPNITPRNRTPRTLPITQFQITSQMHKNLYTRLCRPMNRHREIDKRNTGEEVPFLCFDAKCWISRREQCSQCEDSEDERDGVPTAILRPLERIHTFKYIIYEIFSLECAPCVGSVDEV